MAKAEISSQLNENFPEYTVTEISQLLKKTVEDNFSYIRIRGEISGLKIAPSGHAYFSLKDNNALISAVCWRGTLSNLQFKPTEGAEVTCIGSITTYPGQSKYQIVVNAIQLSGIGSLMALLEQRKQQFNKEGLFSSENKKPLPFLPKIVGVVTSPTGSVIQDIIHRIEDRFPTRILVWPVLVQGDQSAKQVADAIKGFNSLEEKPDVIIVARGGGSIEDLWSFNEEIVVRAAFESIIPIISAVGHETDTTLIDYVADRRAPTPTAAAEIAVPVRSQLLFTIEELGQRLFHKINFYISHLETRLLSYVRGLPNIKSLVNNYVQRLDDLSIRLLESCPRYFDKLHSLLDRYKSSFTAERLDVEISKQQRILTDLVSRFNVASKNTFANKQRELANLASLLESYSHKNTLKRGFALITDKHNNLVKTIDGLVSSEEYSVELSDGKKSVFIK